MITGMLVGSVLNICDELAVYDLDRGSGPAEVDAPVSRSLCPFNTHTHL